MRRFKYMFSMSVEKDLLRKRIDRLNPESKHKFLAYRRFNRVFGSLYWGLFVLFLSVMAVLQHMIEPVLGKMLFIFIVIIMSFILPALLLGKPYMKQSKKYPYQKLDGIPRELISQCNQKPLRFYKIPDVYVITKCYDCTNKVLAEKDLLLFFYKRKLRIVNDLTSTIRDFGCYEFGMNEIELSYGKADHRVTTEIRAQGFFVSLGWRAKPFIVKGWGK